MFAPNSWIPRSRATISRRFQEALRAPSPQQDLIDGRNIYFEFEFLQGTKLMKLPKFSIKPGDLIQVKAFNLATLTFPIDLVNFHICDEKLIEEYEIEDQKLNTVYQAVRFYENELPSSRKQETAYNKLPREDTSKGTPVVVDDKDRFKRAVILKNPTVNEYTHIHCYLIDEGIEFMARANYTFYTVEHVWKLPPFVMRFHLKGMEAFRNKTTYLQLLQSELDPAVRQITAKILGKDGNFRVQLYSSQILKELGSGKTINEILMEKMSKKSEMMEKLPDLGQKHFSSVYSVPITGANWGPLDGPVVEMGVGAIVHIVVLGNDGPGKMFVMPRYGYESVTSRRIHIDCQKYLESEADVFGPTPCNCLKDGYDFVVEEQNGTIEFCRVKIPDIERRIEVQEVSKMKKNNLIEVLSVDRGYYAKVKVENLKRMNPEMGHFPALGAQLIWNCEGYTWDKADWDRFMVYAKNREVRAKVLDYRVNKSRVEFRAELYTEGKNGDIRLNPRTKFWEWVRKPMKDTN